MQIRNQVQSQKTGRVQNQNKQSPRQQEKIEKLYAGRVRKQVQDIRDSRMKSFIGKVAEFVTGKEITIE